MTPSRYAAILFILCLENTGCEFRPDNQFIVVSGPIHIAAGTTVVIKSPEPILTQYYVNMLCLQPSAPNSFSEKLETGFGILSSDGKQLFSPNVLLRNAVSEEDILEPDGYLGGSNGNFICFTLKRINDHEIHHKYHSPYTTVEIMSPSDLQLNKVTWFSGDK